MRHAGFLGFALFSLVIAGCGDRPPGTWPSGDWKVAAPEAQGIDGTALERAREYAFVEGRNTQGVVIVRGGTIVAEWYAAGASADSWAASWSVAKSFSSALVGMAIDEGLISGVDEPMSTFIPEWAGTDKANIALRDVLQMATGLKWNENYDPSAFTASDVIGLTLSGGGELAYAAGRPVAQPPGTQFNYSSGNSMLLSAVIESATGMPAAEYAREKLFDPLGIANADWWRSSAGDTLTFCCLDMTSRNFARFGLLYARGGRWRGKSLISESWVRESTAPSPAFGGYGYQFWLLGRTAELPPDTFAARGVDGQAIYIVPHLDLVVVRNGRYIKDPGEPVADPNLIAHYPPFGLRPDLGTFPPSSWNDAEFLNLVLDAVQSAD